MGEQLLGSPRPGHGRVFVNCNRQGEWWASWPDDYPEDEVRDGEPGNRATVPVMRRELDRSTRTPPPDLAAMTQHRSM
jgi:hypothetical protein